VFQDADEDRSIRYLPAQLAEDVEAWIPAVPSSTAPLYLQRSQDVYYWYTYLEGSQAVYFQHNACAEMDDVPFWRFLKDMFDAMRAAGAQRLIIDLRRNTGGRLESVGSVLGYLRVYPEYARQGRLIVLVGGNTFSSAVYLTSLLRETAAATLVGEPTSQGPNFYGSFRETLLPNSGLEVHIPLVFWQSSEEDYTSAIEPDVWVQLSSEDYFSAHDPVLERALFGP